MRSVFKVLAGIVIGLLLTSFLLVHQKEIKAIELPVGIGFLIAATMIAVLVIIGLISIILDLADLKAKPVAKPVPRVAKPVVNEIYLSNHYYIKCIEWFEYYGYGEDAKRVLNEPPQVVYYIYRVQQIMKAPRLIRYGRKFRFESYNSIRDMSIYAGVLAGEPDIPAHICTRVEY